MVTENQDAVFEVFVTGISVPTIIWFLGDRQVTPDDQHKIISEGGLSRLIIQSVKLGADQEVRCICGDVETRAKLTIKGIQSFVFFIIYFYVILRHRTSVHDLACRESLLEVCSAAQTFNSAIHATE